MNKIAIGIDFGTTNTSIAYMSYNNNNNETYPDCFQIKGRKYAKTLLTYINPDNYYIDEEALNHSYQYPKGFIRSIKRKIANDINFTIFDKSSDDIISDYLKVLYKKIEPQLPLESSINRVIMGVPIGFSDKNKNIYLKALSKAGFFDSREEAKIGTVFVSEPIAAVLDYNLTLKENKNVMVFDFGGGTLDMVIMKMDNVIRQNEVHEHDVISKSGNLHLGGDDFDRAILEEIVAEKVGIRKLKRDLKIDSFEDIYIVKDGIELLKAVQIAKEELSSMTLTKLSLISGNLNINVEITRQEFEMAIKQYITKISNAIKDCLREANQGKGLSPEDIDVVVLAGGSSLVPIIQETLMSIFGRGKVKVHGDSLTSIARGLAVRGSISDNINDIIEHSYGVKSLNINREIYTRDIVSKGLTIDQINGDKYYYEVELVEEAKGKNSFSIIICEDGKEIGKARVPINQNSLMDESFYKIFFKVDKNRETLELYIWDQLRDRKVDIPVTYTISLKNNNSDT
jgi:molecular chaperone DnaK (HSP70)